MLPAALAVRSALKLSRTTCTVNSVALGLALLSIGCATTSGRVPREGTNEVPEYLGSSHRVRNASETVDTNPTVIWRTEAGRGSTGAVAMGERLTLITSIDRFVNAIDTRDGKRHWRFRGVNPYGTGPIVHEGRVYAATEGNPGAINAINLYNGRRRWHVALGDVSTPLTYRDGTVYVAVQEGTLYALRADNGKRRWIHAGVPTRSGPIVVGGKVALVTITDSLIVLDAATGISSSRTAVGAGTVAPLAAVDDSTVIMTSPAGEVVALSIPSGRVKWRRSTNAQVLGSAVVARDTVFALTNGCVLWRMPTDGTEPLASEPIGCQTSTAPAVVREGVIVATIDGRLVYFNTAQGRVVWSHDLGEELRHPPMILNGQMIVVPIKGKVVSLR